MRGRACDMDNYIKDRCVTRPLLRPFGVVDRQTRSQNRLQSGRSRIALRNCFCRKKANGAGNTDKRTSSAKEICREIGVSKCVLVARLEPFLVVWPPE